MATLISLFEVGKIHTIIFNSVEFRNCFVTDYTFSTFGGITFVTVSMDFTSSMKYFGYGSSLIIKDENLYVPSNYIDNVKVDIDSVNSNASTVDSLISNTGKGSLTFRFLNTITVQPFDLDKMKLVNEDIDRLDDVIRFKFDSEGDIF